MCGLLFLLRRFPLVEFFEITYLESDFLTASQKENLKLYERILPCSIRFKTAEECIELGFKFDIGLSLSTTFRAVSPRVYHAENKELSDLGINTDHPIWSDINGIDNFIFRVLNVQRLLLNLTKVGGVVILYPCAVSFSVFRAYEGDNNDFSILDREAEVTWEDCLNANWPQFETSPVTLQLSKDPLSSSMDFIAAEMLDSGKRTRLQATYRE